MRKMFLLGIAALATAGTAASVGNKPAAVINESDNGRTLQVPVNAEIRAVLTQRFDQEWGLYGPAQVTLVERPTVEALAVSPDRISKLSQRTFRVRVTEPGRYPVTFRLRGIQATANTKPEHEITVTVDAT